MTEALRKEIAVPVPEAVRAAVLVAVMEASQMVAAKIQMGVMPDTMNPDTMNPDTMNPDTMNPDMTILVTADITTTVMMNPEIQAIAMKTDIMMRMEIIRNIEYHLN